MSGGNIFISYRRGQDSHAAARLAKRYGAESVFFDVDSMYASGLPDLADFLTPESLTLR